MWRLIFIGLLNYLFVGIHEGQHCSSAVVNSFDSPEVNVVVIDKEYIKVTWKREGPWNNINDFYVDFKADGERPTGDPCTSQLIPCDIDVCTLNSKDRCPPFGLCRDVTVVVRSQGYDSEGISVRTDGYTPAFVSVESNNGTLIVSWIGPENEDGDCYGGSLLTIFTPWTEYSASFTGNHSHYRHTQDLTACDVGKVAASLRSFDLMGNSGTVTNGTEYLGENASPVISDLKSTPGRRGAFVRWDLLGKCSRVTSFHLVWIPSDAGGEIIVSDTFANITGLSPCQEFILRVQPLEGRDDLGGQKSVALFTESEAPQAPSSIAVLMVKNEPNHLVVTWTQPAPPGPLCNITKNSVRWFQSETGETVGQDEITASTAYFITGLKAYTNYTICIASKTVGGFSPEGSGYNTTDQDIPGPPIICSPEVVSPSSLLVTWERPPQPNGIITGYKTEWRYENQNHSAYVTNNETYYIITNLTACVFHEITVMAETIKGFGERSYENTTMRVAPGAPGQVDAVMVANISDQLWLTWSQPNPYGKCTIINNKVTWVWQNMGEYKKNDTTIPKSSNYIITGLRPYTMYTVCVAAQTEGGFGPHGECDNVYTEEDTPGPPEVIDIVQSSNNIYLEWETPDEPNGIILLYNLSWINVAESSDKGSVILPANQTSYKIKGLQSESVYSVLILAKTSAGWGTVSEKVVSTKKMITWPYWLAGETLLAILAVFVWRRLRGNTRHGVIQPKDDSFQNEAFIPDESSSDNHQMIQVEDREENDHEEITMSESTTEGNDTSSNSVYRESREMIQVEDREENDHEEMTMSNSTTEGNDTSSNSVYRESRGEGKQYEKTDGYDMLNMAWVSLLNV